MIRLIHLLGVKYFILIFISDVSSQNKNTYAMLLGNSKMTYGYLLALA